jgi:prepilin-type N-terminal cleavage/methylation domain-containing protein
LDVGKTNKQKTKTTVKREADIMKINIALNNNGQRKSLGFTLIEMIGVLAVIAILAALLVPKVTSAISDAKVNNAISTYQTVQTAAASHYSKYNAFNIITNGVVSIPAGGWGGWDTNCLLIEGFLDSPVSLKIGTSSVVQVVAGEGNEVSGAAAGYLLDGTDNGTANNAYTVELVINGITRQDAYDLASRIDGTTLAGAAPNSSINGGRVVYKDGSTAGTGSAYLYVAGR